MNVITAYEFNRFMQDGGKLRLSPEDSKLAGVMLFAQSLAVDEGFRDREVFTTFLKRYNLPENISLSDVTSALAAHSGHNYAGDPAVIARLKTLISPDALASLKRPEVGVPVTIL